MIKFNKPFFVGKETHYIKDAVNKGKISGNGEYTKLCHRFFESRYNFKKCLLTTSCTDALEMCSILLEIKDGDEVIIPSYTFVSTANAFILRGAKVVFADSYNNNPNIDVNCLESLITKKTKVIVVVHYAGVACDMDKIMKLAKKHNLFVVEDAAHSIDSTYKEIPLGGIGHLAAFSFHETKNIISGEGGMLVINDEKFMARAEIIWEKGTNRAAFYRNEIDKYGWVDIGSSFLPSEIISAVLYAQIENIDKIQARRKKIWEQYYKLLNNLKNYNVSLPLIPDYATNNGHMFYLVCSSFHERNNLINYLKLKSISAVFHYQSLHKSPYFEKYYFGGNLKNSEKFQNCIIRLPLYYEMKNKDVEYIAKTIQEFYEK